MKEQVTEKEKRELDRDRESRQTKQPYASEIDDRELEGSKVDPQRKEPAKAPAK